MLRTRSHRREASLVCRGEPVIPSPQGGPLLCLKKQEEAPTRVSLSLALSLSVSLSLSLSLAAARYLEQIEGQRGLSIFSSLVKNIRLQGSRSTYYGAGEIKQDPACQQLESDLQSRILPADGLPDLVSGPHHIL